MDSNSILSSYWSLCALFAAAAIFELFRERKRQLFYGRGFALGVVAVAIILLVAQNMAGVAPSAGVSFQDDLSRQASRASSYVEHIAFSGERLFAVLTVGILTAGILFSSSAPLVRVRMSRIFALQALLFGLIHVQTIEWFLLIGILITLGFIFSVRDDCKRLTDDERRFLRARSFLVYQSLALVAMSMGLGLRILEAAEIVSYTKVLGSIDLVCLCVASAISMGMFPFHGWILPFLGSPRATVFLPMLCIQTGLLFFFRVYAPIVSTYSDHSLLFVGIPVVGLLYSALLFFGESRLKRIPGNLYLNHVCLMSITVVGLDATSYTAAILDSVNTVVATLGLIGLCALLTSRFGVRGVISPTGLGSFFPEIAVCYLICVLSLVSFPGTLGFIEEEVLLGQAVGHQNFLVAVIAIALTLNGFSSFRLFARVFMGQPLLGQDTETGLFLRERVIIYAILAVIVMNGLAPSYIVDTLSHMR